LDDLAAHKSQWVAPLALDYGDRTLHELPPNGQGLAALIALGILKRFGIQEFPVDSADSFHLQIEAMKIAFAEVHRHVADRDHMEIDPQALLTDDVLAQQAGEISMARAGRPRMRTPTEKGTVYLTAADDQGLMVSYIQSNYNGFGSGIVIPGTGISLHNRGCGFTLQAGHPNQVGGGKRPFHTIIPAFVTQGEEPLMSFGVMGAHMQAQGHVQMMVRIFDYNQNPQAASDAPRWYVAEDGRIALEAGFDPATAANLKDRGHAVMADPEMSLFGGAQLIYRLPGGAYAGASDHRKDGQAAGY
jgi:gamma-glutamyltranspeptidase/glutathione hydrolase